MENCQISYIACRDGNARKRKKEAERKKRQSEKMAMKQRKSCGNLKPKFQPKTMQKNDFRWKPSKVNASMKMKMRKKHSFHLE